jgi:ubiquitin fusion degradation protein 1
MSSDSEISSIDLNDINVADQLDFYPSEFEDDTPPTSPEPYLSFVQKVYPLTFYYDYDSVKLKEYSNRIILPMYVLDSISKDERIEYPLFFYILKDEKRHYFSVEKFLPDVSDFYIPNHIFEQLGIEYGEHQELMIDFKTLVKGTHLVLEPHDKEFLKVPNPKVYLETHLVRSYPCLSQGSVIRIIYGREYIDFNVKETKPSNYITTLDTDIEVDFEKPLNYVEPPPKKEYKPPIKKEYNSTDKKDEGFVPFSGKSNKLSD